MKNSSRKISDFIWNDTARPFRLTEAEQIPREFASTEQMKLARRRLESRGRGDIIAGAAPFDPDAPGALWVGTPMPVSLAPPISGGIKAEHTNVMRSDERLDVRNMTSRESFLASVEDALARINGGVLDKVVLSRAVEVVAQVEFDVQRLLKQLATDSSTLAFAFKDGERHIVGASPEVLVSKRGAILESGPLAGSMAREIDPRRDQAVANFLLNSQKDLAEHAFVIEDLADRLSTAGTVSVDGPNLFSTNTIWHLKSTIRAVLRPGDTRDSLDFARFLHPTAAVCGWPGDVARRVIREIEGRDRGFYTGYVGWQDGDGDGDWRIILRAASVSGRCAILDTGAGIVRESQPIAEFAETAVKLLPMLQALQTIVGADCDFTVGGLASSTITGCGEE